MYSKLSTYSTCIVVKRNYKKHRAECQRRCIPMRQNLSLKFPLIPLGDFSDKGSAIPTIIAVKGKPPDSESHSIIDIGA